MCIARLWAPFRTKTRADRSRRPWRPDRDWQEIRSKFVQRLDSELFTDNFSRGNDLVLSWKCTEVNPGNRALRYFVGFGAGAGVMTISATLSDSERPCPRDKAEVKGVQT